MMVKGNPVLLFWEKATVWRKLKLLRSLNSIKESMAEKYIDEMIGLHRKGGGFSKALDESSSVTPTAEAIINLTHLKKDLSVIKEAVNFLWKMQKQNGSWHENPELPKDKVPFWSSIEKGVPILTADCVEALVVAGYHNDKRITKAIEWLKQMQSPTGMWLSIEDTEPNDTEPDSTQRAISALISFGMSVDSLVIRKACKALEQFIIREALEWAKTHPPVWPWIAALDGLIAAGYKVSSTTVQFALKNILELQQEDGSWPNGYELRVVPTLISLDVISSEQALKIIKTIEQKT